MTASLRVDVVVIGAGFAGIAQAIALREAGVESFVVLERAPRIGGTWRDNTYPGIACDIPSHLYELGAHPWPYWSRAFAPGAEIQAYLERVVTEESLSPHILLNTSMSAAQWDGVAWRITAMRGTGHPDTSASEIIADHLVLACGRLTEPRIPAIAGLGTFRGPLFHSARWDHGALHGDLTGQRIGVVGTGASAIQLVPELARRGADVVLFQRSPAWIVPRGDHPVDEADIRRYADDPSALRAHRERLFAEGEQRFASRSGDENAAAATRDVALDHLAEQVPDPDLRQALTPDYAFGCKRVLLSDDFYPAIASGQVRLEPSALERASGSTLTAASGATYDVDALVLATGFETAEQPYARLVTGDNGETLAEHWSTGMAAVASTLVAGFPNLFVVNGPNASLGHNSSVLISEAQAEFAAALIAERTAAPFAYPDPVRVTQAEEDAASRDVAQRAARTPWVTGGCSNWYVDDRSGRLTLLWPGTVADFRLRLSSARVRSRRLTQNEGAPS